MRSNEKFTQRAEYAIEKAGAAAGNMGHSYVGTEHLLLGILRGCGLMGRFMVATFTDLILRVGMAIVLSGTELGSTGIWLSWPIGWCIGTVLSIVFYATAIRKALAEPVAQAEAQGLEEEPVAQAEFAAQAEMETL